MTSTMLVDATTVWDGLLRSYGRALGDQRDLLLAIDADADGDADGDLVDLVLPVFVPPTDAPPMPDELRPLADALVAETERLIDLARDIAARLPAPSMVQRRFTSGAEGGALDRAL
jgi:hypothetical protein